MRKKEKKLRVISICLPEEVISQLDHLAEKADMSRSKLISNLVEVVTPDLIRCDKIGLWKFNILLRDFQEACKQWVCSCIEEPGYVGQVDAPDSICTEQGFVPLDQYINSLSKSP